jgi:methylated-DNA-[protein]-cysteine S-methyltransferase
LQLLKEEGVEFDANGFLLDKSLLWDDFDTQKLK